MTFRTEDDRSKDADELRDKKFRGGNFSLTAKLFEKKN